MHQLRWVATDIVSSIRSLFERPQGVSSFRCLLLLSHNRPKNKFCIYIYILHPQKALSWLKKLQTSSCVFFPNICKLLEGTTFGPTRGKRPTWSQMDQTGRLCSSTHWFSVSMVVIFQDVLSFDLFYVSVAVAVWWGSAPSLRCLCPPR